MDITISKYAGFCEGAKRAYDITIKVAEKNNKNLYILGDLLHNKHISDEIKSLGIKKVESIKEIKKGSLIISAHGISKSIIQQAEKKALNIINTTCPKVIRIQQIVKKYHQDKATIFIFGDKNHKEVKGINGWCDNKAIIISNVKDVKNIDPALFPHNIKSDEKNNLSVYPHRKDLKHSERYWMKEAVIVSQTTQKSKNFLQIAKLLQKKIKNLKIFNTICETTKNRQKEIEKISNKNDAVVVIGGKKSANSRRLYEIAKKNNKNVFFVNNTYEIDLKKFSNFKKIGITAGASTPDWLIKNIYKKLKAL